MHKASTTKALFSPTAPARGMFQQAPRPTRRLCSWYVPYPNLGSRYRRSFLSTALISGAFRPVGYWWDDMQSTQISKRPLLQVHGSKHRRSICSSFDSRSFYLTNAKPACHICKCTPLNALVLIDPFDEPLVHHDDLWFTRYLWMYRDREHEAVILSVSRTRIALSRTFRSGEDPQIQHFQVLALAGRLANRRYANLPGPRLTKSSSEQTWDASTHVPKQSPCSWCLSMNPVREEANTAANRDA